MEFQRVGTEEHKWEAKCEFFRIKGESGKEEMVVRRSYYVKPDGTPAATWAFQESYMEVPLYHPSAVHLESEYQALLARERRRPVLRIVNDMVPPVRDTVHVTAFVYTEGSGDINPPAVRRSYERDGRVTWQLDPLSHEEVWSPSEPDSIAFGLEEAYAAWVMKKRADDLDDQGVDICSDGAGFSEADSWVRHDAGGGEECLRCGFRAEDGKSLPVGTFYEHERSRAIRGWVGGNALVKWCAIRKG